MILFRTKNNSPDPTGLLADRLSFHIRLGVERFPLFLRDIKKGFPATTLPCFSALTQH